MATSWSRGLQARLLAALVVLGGTAGGSLGCSHTCEDTFSCEDVCPEDPGAPGAGEIPSACGIWVSASLGDDGNDGSQGAPVATLDQALSLALAGPRRVYACSETFSGPLIWPARVSLHGGFTCADLDWHLEAEAEPTTLTAPANEIPLTLTGSSNTSASILTDLRVVASDATVPGGSSIAVLVWPDARAEIRRSSMESGNGADGLDGNSGDHLIPATDGLLGNNGVAACAAPFGKGGQVVTLDCGDSVSFGGRGGHGGELSANPGDDGAVAPSGDPQGFGAGGDGEDVGAGLPCTPGLGGAAGKDGDPGKGAAGAPRLTTAGYAGVWGRDGQRGLPGQGGGGGGASAGNTACGALPHGGAGGGSGGTGGCGGGGGRGGQPGGASIAVATLTPDLVLVEVDLLVGNGGRGGAGGMPQQGGQGGLPGIGGGGQPMDGGPLPACAGGAGGYGGDGGHAGGGLGGPTILVAFAGARAPALINYFSAIGAAGEGGPGSDPSMLGGAGDNGLEGHLVPLSP